MGRHTRTVCCLVALCLAAHHAAAKATPPRKMPSGLNLVRAAHTEEEAHFGQYLLRVHAEEGKARFIKSELEQFSHGPVRYVPHDTYIVTLDPGQVAQVRALDGVEEVFLVPAEMRMDAARRRLQQRHPQSKEEAKSETSIHATLAISQQKANQRKLDVKEVAQAIKDKTGAHVRINWASSSSFDVRAHPTDAQKVVDALHTMELVHHATVEPHNYIMSKVGDQEGAAEAGVRNKWAANLVQSGTGTDSPLWDIGLQGQGQVVGCGDSGIDVDSCFFFEQMPLGSCKGEGFIPYCNSSNHRKIVTYRTVSSSEFGDDDWPGHGTHVAGTIAGQSTNPAMSEFDGVAPMAKIAFDDIGVESTGYLSVPFAYEETLWPHAYGYGAKLHSNSWGDSRPYYAETSYSNDKFSAENDDFLLLFAAGNDGPFPWSVSSQSAGKNVVSVGAGQNDPASYEDATEALNKSIHNVAIFSSKGPTVDGRFKPTVVAPGENIMSADSDGVPYTFQCSSGVTDGLEMLSGTSMATPAVAGGAALVRQYLEQGFFVDGTANPAAGVMPSAALVTAVLIHSGQPMSYYSWDTFTLQPPPATLPHSSQGFGRVDLSSVLALPTSPFQLHFFDRQNISMADGEVCRGFQVEGGKFKVSLAYTDPEASIYSAFYRTLIQDLDLVVVSPSGAVMRGNHLDGDVADRRNNQEQVTVADAEPGVWSVKVLAHDLPLGPQAYALVVTGNATEGPACPAQACTNCSVHGDCEHGQCRCHRGFGGADCGTQEQAPPYAPSCELATIADISGTFLAGRVSSEDVLGLSFNTDPHVGDEGMKALWPGFKGTYRFGEPSVVSQCNSGTPPVMIHREDDGVITTGGSYMDNTECTWYLRSKAKKMTFQFTSLDLEMNWDWLSIEECADTSCSSKTHVPGSPFTGYTLPDMFVTGKVVLITLQSDGSINYGGFELLFTRGRAPTKECVPGQLTVIQPTFAQWGVVKTPELDGTYPPNMDCTFAIGPSPTGGNTTLDITSFGSEADIDVLRVTTLDPACFA